MSQFNVSVFQLTWKKFFSFFTSLKILCGLDCYFLKVFIANKTLRKSKTILSLNNFKILRIKINEKLGFEITLKGADK